MTAMASRKQRRAKRWAAQAGAAVPEALAGSVKGASQIAAAAVRGGQREGVLSAEASARLLKLIRSVGAEKGQQVGALLKRARDLLGAVATKYSIKSLGRLLGFADDEALMKYLHARLMALEAQDKSDAEFHAGALGRQNAFLGELFELCVKYGPFRRIVSALADGALDVINREIADAAGSGRVHQMNDAAGKTVKVGRPFSKSVVGNAFDIDTAKGEKGWLDFGAVGFNKDGQWCLPLPVEIKLPRAAGAVAEQFADFLRRITAAAEAGRKVFAYFDAADEAAIVKFVGKAAVVGVEQVDGRPMVKVALDPRKLVFNPDELYNAMRLNQLVVRPDARVWRPQEPQALPQLRPEPKFVIDAVDGRPVSVEVSASSKGKGFNFWRMLVPVERSLLLDVYAAIFKAS